MHARIFIDQGTSGRIGSVCDRTSFTLTKEPGVRADVSLVDSIGGCRFRDMTACACENSSYCT